MEKKLYSAPESELIEMKLVAAVLGASDFGSSSVEGADYRNDISWD
jgi:hypothetical protein